MRPFMLPLTLSLALSIAPAAVAQTKQTNDEYGYRFHDDYLLGDTIGTTPPLIRGVKKHLRVQLLRPRASFVAEMLKSVEAL